MQQKPSNKLPRLRGKKNRLDKSRCDRRKMLKDKSEKRSVYFVMRNVSRRSRMISRLSKMIANV